MKQIICEFGNAKAISDFNPCLCSHVAVPVSLESEKDDEIAGTYVVNKIQLKFDCALKQ